MTHVEEKAEKAVLGAMLVNQNVIPEVLTKLDGRDFYFPQHEVVFTAISARFAKGDEVDSLTISSDLMERGGIDPMIVMGLVEAAPIVANVGTHVEIVSNCAARRRLGEIGVKMQQLANSGEQPDQIIAEAENALNGAVKIDESESITVGQALDRVLDAVSAREKGEVPTGLMTGFKDLDELTNGLRGGQMIIVAARPGVGKTTLAVDFMRHISIHNGVPSLIFSLEMGKDELTERIISAEAEVPTYSLKTGRMTTEDWEKVSSAADRLEEAPLHIADSAEVTMMDISARSRMMVKKHGIKMIVVDYLQLLTSGKREESRQQEVSSFSRQLKLLAKSLDVPIIAIAQLNRGVELRGEDAKPKASDLRESGSLEQDADIIILIHRPDVANKEHARAGEADLIIAKHRGGSTGTITIAHQLHYSKFTNPTGLPLGY